MWYKLDGDTIVKVGPLGDAASTREVAKSRERKNVTILDMYDKDEYRVLTIRVSTVFLGLDHSFGAISGDKDPILFETMAFIDKQDSSIKLDAEEYLSREEIQYRYRTIHGARKGHKRLVEHIQNELIKKGVGKVAVNDIHLSL